MEIENNQKLSNLYKINDNIKKIPNRPDNGLNKTKNRNLITQTNSNIKNSSINGKNKIITQRNLTKVNSYSKGIRMKSKNEKRNKSLKLKKGKSCTSLKCQIRNNNNITNNHSKKNSYLSTFNSLSKETYSYNKKISPNFKQNKNNILKISNISTPNIENTCPNLNTNLNFEHKNNPSSISNSNSEEKSKNVKVFIRFRPSNELETSLLHNNYGWLVPKFISDKQLGIYTKNSYEYNCPNTEIPKNFIFSYDKIFSPNSNQLEIYSNVGKRIVEDIMAGYNGTIFAYGQSGSGKTYTMYGNDIYDHDSKGVIPRIVEEIFKRVEKSDRNIDFQFKLSVLEIYKEVLFDLFTQENNLKIIENKETGIYIENLSQVYLSSIEEFFNYVDLAQKNRKVAETKLNHNSSRSHCIMILEVEQSYRKEKIIKKGILNLVDLAGSEKVSKTGAVGETLEEAKKINLSLSTLGNVIHALTQGLGHVPFRDSKLTRILKESLGGNYKTYLIVTCSPHSYNLDEIISSLLFAKRVKCIKNKYKINIKYSYEELQNLVDNLNEKLLLANKKIYKLLNGEKINLDEESFYKTKSCNNCDLLLKEKKILENKIQELMDNIQEKDNEISKLKEEIQNLNKIQNFNETNNNNTNRIINSKINNDMNKQKDINNNLKESSNNISNNINNDKDNVSNLNSKNIYKKFKSLNKITEVSSSVIAERNKKVDLSELYKKIKEKLSKIEEENERIKIIQNEEEEIRKINLKKEQFNQIIQDFVRNKDKLKCFEKLDNITKVSIPYVKDKDYKNLFNEFKINICDIFAESFTKQNNNLNNFSPQKLLDIITTNLFFEYLHFYFSQQIINQGYLKLILDNNSLHKMNKYLFDIVRDVLSKNLEIANENAINVNAINYLSASIRESLISKPSNSNVINDFNQKIIKVVSKNNINFKNNFKLNSLNNILPENNNTNFSTNIIQGYDFNNLNNFNNENNPLYINKLKSQEFVNNSNKIQMIRDVLVSIIKETDYIRNDVKELKDNLNASIKSIMNYFCQKIFKNEFINLDLNDNFVIENENKLKSKNITENVDSNNNNLDNPKIIYKNDNINKKILKIVPNQNNNNNIKNVKKKNNNQTSDYPSEKIEPNYSINMNYYRNINDILTNNSSTPLISISSTSSKNEYKKIIIDDNPKKDKNKKIDLKSLKKNNNENICNNINKCLDSGTATRKFDNMAPIPKKIIQAKGDDVCNENYFVLSQH